MRGYLPAATSAATMSRIKSEGRVSPVLAGGVPALPVPDACSIARKTQTRVYAGRLLIQTPASRNVLFRLELGEYDYVANTFLSQQHHAEAVDPQSHPAGRRHPVLQSDEKILIQFLLLTAGLVLQTLALLDRIILL